MRGRASYFSRPSSATLQADDLCDAVLDRLGPEHTGEHQGDHPRQGHLPDHPISKHDQADLQTFETLKTSLCQSPRLRSQKHSSSWVIY